MGGSGNIVPDGAQGLVHRYAGQSEPDDCGLHCQSRQCPRQHCPGNGIHARRLPLRGHRLRRNRCGHPHRPVFRPAVCRRGHPSALPQCLRRLLFPGSVQTLRRQWHEVLFPPQCRPFRPLALHYGNICRHYRNLRPLWGYDAGSQLNTGADDDAFLLFHGRIRIRRGGIDRKVYRNGEQGRSREDSASRIRLEHGCRSALCLHICDSRGSRAQAPDL